MIAKYIGILASGLQASLHPGRGNAGPTVPAPMAVAAAEVADPAFLQTFMRLRSRVRAGVL